MLKIDEKSKPCVSKMWKTYLAGGKYYDIRFDFLRNDEKIFLIGEKYIKVTITLFHTWPKS